MELDQAAGLRKGNGGSCVKGVLSNRLRCVAVGSGKGGVGKTMVSIGLSLSLVKKGYKVLILDADLGLANVDIQMGLTPSFTLQDVVMGGCVIEDAVMHSDGGPDVLAAASGSPELVDMGDARREMLVNELIRFASGYDFLIIDVGAGIGNGVTAFLKAAPDVLVVVANEPTSIMDAYALIKILSRSKDVASLAIVVNMVRSIKEGEMLAKRLNGITNRFLGIELPVAGVVLYDAVVGDSIRACTPVLSYAPKSAPAQCLEDLAVSVVANRRCVESGKKLGTAFFDSLTRIGVERPREGASVIGSQEMSGVDSVEVK